MTSRYNTYCDENSPNIVGMTARYYCEVAARSEEIHFRLSTRNRNSDSGAGYLPYLSCNE